jgi:uncharacterized protein YeaO (DUF488 family)
VTLIRLARAYDPWSPDDGFRVLVDRLWPRGVTKARLHLDLWARDAAPSSALREWWHHDPSRFAEFAERYRQELASGSALRDLARACGAAPVATLVFGAKDRKVNHAVVLREAITELLP